jgi:hypothetical protein
MFRMKTIKIIFVILLTAFVAACGGGGGGAPGGNSGGGSSGPIYTVTTLNLNPLTLATPSGLSIDTNGNLYVADTSVDLIKKIQNLSSNTPSVSSVLGGGGTDYNTCSGSKLYSPYGVAVDSARYMLLNAIKRLLDMQIAQVPPGFQPNMVRLVEAKHSQAPVALRCQEASCMWLIQATS